MSGASPRKRGTSTASLKRQRRAPAAPPRAPQRTEAAQAFLNPTALFSNCFSYTSTNTTWPKKIQSHTKTKTKSV